MIDVILSEVLHNKEYFSKVWPYLNDSYFDEGPGKILYRTIKTHVDTYNSVPTSVAIAHALDSSTLKESQVKESKNLLKDLKPSNEDLKWLVDSTEKYVQQTAAYNATSRIIEIQKNAELPEDQRDRKIPEMGAILDIMKDAISVSFNTSLGHNWANDFEERWLAYKEKSYKIPFRLNILNKISKNGVEKATLNLLLAGVNVGKSLGLCSLAADYIKDGKNVMYFSMEMSEFACAKRIDANLLDVTLDDIDDGNIGYSEYKKKMEKYQANESMGLLEIKRFPTGGANANTFRSYLNEIKLKKGFVPDIIFVDYLGICSSTRIKVYSENSYTLVKSIAEEMRALAVDFDVPLWSAAQTTRGGWDNSDISMSDIAESAALAATADFILAVIETEELIDAGQQMIKQIKSRYGDKSINNKFLLGVKKGNQRWVELDKDSIESNESYQKSAKDQGSPKTARSKIDDLVNKEKAEKPKKDSKNIEGFKF